MEEIKVNDYIRTSKGQIDIFKEYGYERTCVRCENKKYFTSDITKHSPNIIDLIEDEDIAIIEYYVPKYRQRITRIFECNLFEDFVIFENRNCKWWYNKSKKQWEQAKGYNPKIKAIVTHESFNSIKYEVE